MGRKIALDTNIFIYALEDSGSLGKAALEILEEIKSSTPRVFTSVLTVQELITGLYRDNYEEKVSDYLDFISYNGLITLVDYTKPIALIAAQVRGTYKAIRTPDAIQIATAVFSGASEFYTADTRLPKKIDTIKIIPLVN